MINDNDDNDVHLAQLGLHLGEPEAHGPGLRLTEDLNRLLIDLPGPGDPVDLRGLAQVDVVHLSLLLRIYLEDKSHLVEGLALK